MIANDTHGRRVYFEISIGRDVYVGALRHQYVGVLAAAAASNGIEVLTNSIVRCSNGSVIPNRLAIAD